jgi:hypothetical protein
MDEIGERHLGNISQAAGRRSVRDSRAAARALFLSRRTSETRRAGERRGRNSRISECNGYLLGLNFGPVLRRYGDRRHRQRCKIRHIAGALSDACRRVARSRAGSCCSFAAESANRRARGRHWGVDSVSPGQRRASVEMPSRTRSHRLNHARVTLNRHSGAPHRGGPGIYVPAANVYGFRVPPLGDPGMTAIWSRCGPDPGQAREPPLAVTSRTLKPRRHLATAWDADPRGAMVYARGPR